MSDTNGTILQTLDEVLRVFADLSVPVAVGGSLASGTFGSWRSTQDADIAAAIRPKHVSPFCERLKDSFSIHEPAIRESVARRSRFGLVHLFNVEKVDVFVGDDSPFDVMQFERVVHRTPPRASGWSGTLPFASPEDVVLRKLLWFEKGDRISEKQWRDILGVLANQYGKLDVDYMKSWAFKLHVEGLLDEVLDQAHKNVHGIDDGTSVV